MEGTVLCICCTPEHFPPFSLRTMNFAGITLWRHFIPYAGLGISQALFVLLGTFALAIGGIFASKLLHNRMLESLLRSPMSFFDTTPLGRILNRFSKDIYVIDEAIPRSMRWVYIQFNPLTMHMNMYLFLFPPPPPPPRTLLLILFNIISTFVVIVVVTPIFIVVIVPLGLFYIFIQVDLHVCTLIVLASNLMF